MSVYIIQGQNAGLTVDYGTSQASTLDGATAVEASLWHGVYEIKHWSKSAVTIETGTGKLSLPLTQAETLAFPVGEAVLLVKILDSSSKIWFDEEHTLEIREFKDKTVLTAPTST